MSVTFATLTLAIFALSQQAIPAAPAPNAGTDPYEIRLKSRQFSPQPAAFQPAGTGQADRTRHALIQFEKPTDEAHLQALRDLGIKVRHFVSAHTVAATVPPRVDPMSIPGVRWADELSGKDKADPIPSRLAMVEFFPDTPDADIARILAETGAQRRPTPSLPRYIAYAALPDQADAAERLAQNETVTSVTPAPQAVIDGRSIHYCPGPMTIAGPVASYVLRGEGWDGSGRGSASLTYFFGASTSDLSLPAQRAEIVRALNTWSRYAALTWTETSSARRSRSFDIHFASGDHGDGSPFDGSSGVLAHCYYPSPPNSEPIAGDMHFDEAEMWRVGANFDLFTVALHEAGHGLGLNHSNDPDAVMAPYYAGVVRDLTADDIAGIRALYASSGPPPLPPTPNDSFASATPLSGSSGTVSGSNAEATKEAGEPAHAGNPGGKSLWYRWTAPASGSYVFNTRGSSVDTLLAIYTGSSVSRLSLIAANDDSGEFLTSEVRLNASAGLTYQIAVDGYGGEGGSVMLRWERSTLPILTITRQPSNSTVPAGYPTEFSVAASGAGALSYQWYRDGQALAGATSDTLSFAAARLADQGSYLVRVSDQSASMMSDDATLTVLVQDFVLPRVRVSAPANQSRSFTATVLVSGTASDNNQVARVEYNLNGGGWQTAQGTTEWSALVNPVGGLNTLQVRAVDSAENLSPVVQRAFTRVVTSTLILQATPGGTVLPNLNGRALEVGKRYTIKARPSAGFLFSHWSGASASTEPNLTFVMTENLTLAANFVVNPFMELAGKYNGLFFDTNGVQRPSSGHFSAEVSSRGRFSATIRHLGTRTPLSGQFLLDGKATNVVGRAGSPQIRTELSLDLRTKDRLIGQITSDSWNASLVADRTGSNRGRLSQFEGRYTLLLPGTDDTGNPALLGQATVTVDGDGNATTAGAMADGGCIVQRTTISSEGYIPLHAAFDGGRSSLLGWIRITPDHEQAIHGLVSWIKPGTGQDAGALNQDIHLQSNATGVRIVEATTAAETVE